MIKNNFILLAFFMLYLPANGQPGNTGKKADTTYFFSELRKTTDKDSARFFTIRNYNPADSSLVKITSYTMDGQLLKEQDFSNFTAVLKEGVIRSILPSGVVSKEISYIKGKLEGPFITRWPDGTLKRRDIYRNDALQSGQCFSKYGKDTTYFKYEQYPGFPGGNDSLRKFLQKNLKYPSLAKMDMLEGTVYISFIVQTDGSVSGISVRKGVSPLLDTEAIRVVQMMPAWISGKKDGEESEFFLTLPVVFRLDK